MYNTVNNVNNHTSHGDHSKKTPEHTSVGYIRCEVIEDFADTINSVENVFTYKIDKVLTGDAIVDIVAKVNNIIDNAIVKVVSWLKPVIFLHNAISKEDTIINIVKILGVSIQRLQSSLEDALSFASLLMGLILTLSLILVLVILT